MGGSGGHGADLPFCASVRCPASISDDGMDDEAGKARTRMVECILEINTTTTYQVSKLIAFLPTDIRNWYLICMLP